jgi:hypothetical protein
MRAAPGRVDPARSVEYTFHEVDPDATHMNVVERNIGFALGWIEAVLDGAEPPRCGNEALPACR